MKKILIVDDDSAFRESLVMVIENAGYSVLDCPDGSKALELLKTESFDAAIIDILMPEINGYDLIKAIRKSDKRIKIIAVSGGGKFSNGKNLLSSVKSFGADEIIVKPFSGGVIISILEKLIKDGITILLQRKITKEEKSQSLPKKQVNKVKVLIVEDSTVKAELLKQILTEDSLFEVIKTVPTGEKALEVLNEISPDIITMDINLPGMNGFETADKILTNYSIPIVIISAIRTDYNRDRLQNEMQKCGSLYFLDSPPSPISPEYKKASEKIRRIVRLMAGVKMSPRFKKAVNKDNCNDIAKQDLFKPHSSKVLSKKIVVIGSSTGGPTALVKILSELPKNFSLPIIIAQHIGSGFDLQLIRHLNLCCENKVKTAENNEIALPGHIYVAPGNKLIRVTNTLKIKISDEDIKVICKPSIAVLFKSAAENFGGSAVGIILTGMGVDGAAELKLMKDKGAFTIAQNKESCVVYGMPGEAVKLNAHSKVLPPEKIAEELIMLNNLEANR